MDGWMDGVGLDIRPVDIVQGTAALHPAPQLLYRSVA